MSGGQFGLDKGDYFKSVLGGQFHWLFHAYTPANNDVISCAITANQASYCYVGTASGSTTETVTPQHAVTLNVTSHGVSSVCSGTSVTFYAEQGFNGGSPAYQWKINGVNAGTNSATYAYTPANNDVISCAITANQASYCYVGTASGSTTETVTPTVTPSVSLAANPSGSIVAGTSVTFTATPTNGGAGPAYQWKKNGTNVGTNSTTYTDAALANNDLISCVLTANNACQSAATANSNSITETVTVATPNYVWTGSTSTDWSVSTNWTNNVLPTTAVTVTIPSAPINQPLLRIDVSIGGIVLDGSLNINGHSFTITGSLSGIGFFKGSATSSLILNTSNSNTIIFGTSAADSLLANLTVSGSGTETIGSGLGITGILSVTNGTLNTGNHITLKSTSIANTAVVGPVAGNITGVVTVERYIPQGNRAFRDLAPAVANAGAIYNNWQEKGTNPAGYGMYITGLKAIAPGGVDATTGLDKTFSGNPSLFIYGAGSWPSVTKTKSTNLDPFIGYRASVRGDRTYNIYGSDPVTMVNATTLRTTGNLVIGNVQFTTTNANSNIFTSTAAKLQTGVNNYSFVTNPYACPIDWETVYSNAGTQNVSSSYWYFDPTFMSSGYATYVTYNATPGVQINSNPSKSKLDKYIQPGMAFFVQNSNSSNPALLITEINKAPNSAKTAVFRAESPNYIHASLWKNINGNNTNIDGAVVVFNNDFTRAIGEKDSKKLMNGAENLFISQSNTDLSIVGLPVPTENEEIKLNLSQLVAGTTYQLQLDANQYTTTGVEAFIKDKLTNTIVPATEGINFTATKDATTFQERFSVIFKAAKVNPVIVKGAVSIYPNPVSNGKFNLQMSNMEKGTYTVRVINSLGQEVTSSTFNNEASTIAKTIATKGLSTGVYTVQVIGKTGTYTTELIVK